MTTTRYDIRGDAVMQRASEGGYVEYDDHTAAMADAYRAGAEAMRDVCGHAAAVVGVGSIDFQYLDGQADACRAVLDCAIPPLPTSDDGETTP